MNNHTVRVIYVDPNEPKWEDWGGDIPYVAERRPWVLKFVVFAVVFGWFWWNAIRALVRAWGRFQ